MILCSHELFEFREERSDGMHCQGWVCLKCGHLATGECHHQSWCRQDFCGYEPLPVQEEQPDLLKA